MPQRPPEQHANANRAGNVRTRQYHIGQKEIPRDAEKRSVEIRSLVQGSEAAARKNIHRSGAKTSQELDYYPNCHDDDQGPIPWRLRVVVCRESRKQSALRIQNE